jgi:nitric oxide reductase activation protein
LEDDYLSPPEEEDFENLIETSEDEVLSITKDAESLESDDKEVDLTQGISSKRLHDGISLEIINVRKRPADYKKLVQKNLPLIKGLVNEIRVALESRKVYDLRGLTRGRLHSGSLWKLAVPDPGVFAKRHIPGDIPELAAYILVDLSGSMSFYANGGAKIDHAKNAACVLSETCRELKIPHAITGFRESFHSCTVEHYPVVTYQDNDSSKIVGLSANGNNRDGYSIRVATNELAVRSEPRKILFVLSDGLPAALGYSGPYACQDVREAVMEARKKGIRVISLRFGGTTSEAEFKLMYDTPVFVHDTSLLPKALGTVFKRVLLE